MVHGKSREEDETGQDGECEGTAGVSAMVRRALGLEVGSVS